MKIIEAKQMITIYKIVSKINFTTKLFHNRKNIIHFKNQEELQKCDESVLNSDIQEDEQQVDDDNEIYFKLRKKIIDSENRTKKL